ncbi:MAG: arabinan endo-1,5-alpha-L-arabinosidase [Planctomycetes bacterium]|nr:arabinan endo-1,5-alpha-L-arabinosidase [Planctomycetota bacterium]
MRLSKRPWAFLFMASLPALIPVVVLLGGEEPSPSPGGSRPGAPDGRGLSAHDPSTILKHRGVYWTFTTGRGVTSLRSDDLVRWERGPAAFSAPPAWVKDVVPSQRGHFWAPDVIEHEGRFLLYYSVSAFGRRTSAIGLATSPTLDPGDPRYGWTDQGVVVRTDDSSDHNAIDPCVVRGEKGTLWMAYGSFWSGIKLIELDPRTGKRIAEDSPVHALAHKDQIEAALIHRRGGHYYLFLNWGRCCRGVQSTYNIRVGRSRAITGPYLDKAGADLLKGGGSLVLETEGRFIGPGHAGILKEGERHWLSYHFYDGEDGGRSRLAIRALEWDQDGWPKVQGEMKTPPPTPPGR